MSKFVVLFACLALVHLGQAALNCYACEKSGCEGTPQSKPCGNIVGNGIPACLKQTYKDNVTKKTETIKKCIIAEKDSNGKPVFKCNNQNGETVDCLLCTSDLCNKAPSSVPVTYITFAGVIVALLMSKNLL